MLVHDGDGRTPKIDLIMAISLAFVAGSANSAGFIAFGYFSANMTGNVSMISEHLSMSQSGLASAFLAIVTMFITGAFGASLAIERGKLRRQSNIYALTMLVEVALLLVTGLYAGFAGTAADGIVVVGLLSLTMGVQNAASTRISDGRVRTTHVSGIATDIGVGLALLVSRRRSPDTARITARLSLHAATMLSFLSGGVCGVIGYELLGGFVFCLLSFMLLSLCARYLRPVMPA